jgi:putative flippase GtrA
MILFKKTINAQLLAFLVVGGLTTLIHIGFIALGIETLIPDYRITIGLAYALAVGCYFLVNNKFTSRIVAKLYFKKIIKSEFFTYLVVGGLTALIYFGLIALGIEVLKIDYRIAVSIAYAFAVSFHFLANRKFTFRVVDNKVIRQSIRYLGVLLINYLITISVVFFLVTKHGASTYLSAAISIIVTVGVGYFASKFWVFHNKESLRG